SALLTSCSGEEPRAWQAVEWRFGLHETNTWRPLNDGVMGGMSTGRIVWAEESLVWGGATSLANNGGFASIRSPWGETNLTGMTQVVVVCRGYGGPFKLTLETSERWWMPYAYTSFEPSSEWEEIVLHLPDFQWSQAQMGDLKAVSGSELGSVLRVGLMKYDGTAQPFELEVRSISFQGAD
ncbi:MAG: CIA30 family protein, partial [Flavobacteriales bacterium]